VARPRVASSASAMRWQHENPLSQRPCDEEAYETFGLL
jgi:hypothetical protein